MVRELEDPLSSASDDTCCFFYFSFCLDLQSFFLFCSEHSHRFVFCVCFYFWHIVIASLVQILTQRDLFLNCVTRFGFSNSCRAICTNNLANEGKSYKPINALYYSNLYVSAGMWAVATQLLLHIWRADKCGFIPCFYQDHTWLSSPLTCCSFQWFKLKIISSTRLHEYDTTHKTSTDAQTKRLVFTLHTKIKLKNKAITLLRIFTSWHGHCFQCISIYSKADYKHVIGLI